MNKLDRAVALFVTKTLRELREKYAAAMVVPCATPHRTRDTGRGKLVARFFLPLVLCPPTNVTRHMRRGQHDQLAHSVFAHLACQGRHQRAPLPGRPHVICRRFSSVAPDRHANWPKIAIDKLCVPARAGTEGLGYLRGDRDTDIDEVHEWEHAKARQGYCVLEIFTG